MFCCRGKKRVAVEEKYSNGIITESRLLTREEIHEGQAGVQSIYPVVGMDNISKYYLEIEMYVLYNPSTDVCSVYGTATWDTQVILGGEEYPDAGADDFMVLNWGDAGELKAASRSFSGIYWDGTDIEYSLNIQNAYQGYSWQFREKAGSFGSCMHWANVTADLVKTYPEKQGRETNIQFTYVHTYGSITPTIGISAGYPSGVAGSINVSSTDKAWQIMVDVPGITY